ncbi:MAG: beta-galactosidase trimerization domain-containing protein, partial [Victivallales bacterium]
KLESCLEMIAPFGNREVFQLGDEMSLTWYQQPWDLCFSIHCLKEFRTWLQKQYASLAALNKEWETQFRSWDEVRPMTRLEILTRNSPAPWTDHREFMDLTFRDFLLLYRKRIREKYPEALVGPTGILNTPAVYGGNCNFQSMRKLDMLSSYGVPRIALSFNRDKRQIMRYRGYTSPEAVISQSFWEGLFVGERGANNWMASVFIRPDLNLPAVRRYYSDLIWEFRSGLADLFYDARKLTHDVAIHYSQASLRANFLKSDKKNFFENYQSYFLALENLGLGYRFISPEEIENGELGNFKALILPESSALSEEETAEIEKFVSGGGRLIGDYETGLLDKHCKKLKAGTLDRVFGIVQEKMGIREVKAAERSVPGLDLTYVGSGVKAVSGTPQAFVRIGKRKYPVVISNNYGKGKAVYLNFRPDYCHSRKPSFTRLMEKLLDIKRDIRISPDDETKAVMCSKYSNGNNVYIGILPALPAGNWEKMSFSQLGRKAFYAELELEKARWLYDVRKKKCLGFGRKFRISLTPCQGTVLAALPYDVKKLEISCPEKLEPGTVLQAAIVIGTNGGQASHHVFLAELSGPDGKKVTCYRKIIKTQDGRGTLRIPLALNDTPGKWQLQVSDAATGLIASQVFILQKPLR